MTEDLETKGRGGARYLCVCVETAFIKHISVILVSWCHREQTESYKEILFVSPLIREPHPPTELLSELWSTPSWAGACCLCVFCLNKATSTGQSLDQWWISQPQQRFPQFPADQGLKVQCVGYLALWLQISQTHNSSPPSLQWWMLKIWKAVSRATFR